MKLVWLYRGYQRWLKFVMSWVKFQQTQENLSYQGLFGVSTLRISKEEKINLPLLL